MGVDKVSVIGFGRIGQAFAAQVLRSGIDVHAIDHDEAMVMQFSAGSFDSPEPGVNEILGPAFRSNRLYLSSGPGELRKSDALIIAIPLSVDHEHQPDSRPFINAILSLLPVLENKKLLVIETSLPVGFCRNQLLPALEAAGKIHGRDYLLAHSPERIKSGTMLTQLASIPKIIGGYSEEAAVAARKLYSLFFPAQNLVVVESIESAEMVKMAGMMYRDINIALANQLAIFAGSVGVDLVSLLPVINSDGEAKLLQPGIGVGGHCTPVYPYFMMDSFRRAGLDFTLATESRKINEAMASYAVSLAGPGAPGRTALVLGLSFRAGVREDAFSPAYNLVAVLKSQGFRPVLHDPLYTAEEIIKKGFEPVDDLYGTGADIVFLVTMHDSYQELDFERLAKSGVRQVIDGRNRIRRESVIASGLEYVGIGH